MKKYAYAVGASVLALTLSGLPVIVLAEKDGSESEGQVRIQTQRIASTSVTARIKEQENKQEDQSEAIDTNQIGDEETFGEGEDNFRLRFESTTTQAHSLDELKQTIEKRKVQLKQEVASTTNANQDLAESTNSTRLAVHSFLASKELLGGIGPQVSEIAKQMNDSVATTTNAEARIQSRGFLTRFLFGGDRVAADVISKEVAQNQTRINDLNKLLGEANVSADIQVTLKAQITALQDAQTRLQALAQKEQKMWGLFSWRF